MQQPPLSEQLPPEQRTPPLYLTPPPEQQAYRNAIRQGKTPLPEPHPRSQQLSMPLSSQQSHAPWSSHPLYPGYPPQGYYPPPGYWPQQGYLPGPIPIPAAKRSVRENIKIAALVCWAAYAVLSFAGGTLIYIGALLSIACFILIFFI